jgi:hypothetical protein
MGKMMLERVCSHLLSFVMLSSLRFVVVDDANVSGSDALGCISVKVIGGDVDVEIKMNEVRLAFYIFR